MENTFEEKYIKFSSEYWWFASRRRLLDILLKKYQCQGPILEGGCGSGENFSVLSKYGTVIGIDISEKLARYGQSLGRNIVVGDITRLPFPDETFSTVVLLDVIEHIDDDNLAIKEAFRVLKPEGKIIVSVPAFRWLWSYHDTINGHQRRYSMKELRDLLERHFDILFISYWNFTLFFPSSIQKKIFSNRDNLVPLPSFLNKALEYLSNIDNLLIKAGIKLPIGTSIIAVGAKW
jgi:SAM-dependent methyltransferase